MSDRFCILIMAGGLGTRMKSELPKVLHKINGIPMLVRVIKEALLVNPIKIFIVVGTYKDIISQTLERYDVLENIEFVLQTPALGTGHTIMCAKDRLENYKDHNLVVLSGDVPCFTEDYIKQLGNCNGVSIITRSTEDNNGYGRVIFNDNKFAKIVEEKDATDEEKLVELVNCGVYAFSINGLLNNLDKLSNKNAQSEYYITDLVKILNDDGYDVTSIEMEKHEEYKVMGVNNPHQLKMLEMLMLNDN